MTGVFAVGTWLHAHGRALPDVAFADGFEPGRRRERRRGVLVGAFGTELGARAIAWRNRQALLVSSDAGISPAQITLARIDVQVVLGLRWRSAR